MRLLIDREEQTTDTEGQCQGWWKRDARRGEGRSSCTGKFNHLHLYLLWPCPLPFSLFSSLLWSFFLSFWALLFSSHVPFCLLLSPTFHFSHWTTLFSLSSFCSAPFPLRIHAFSSSLLSLSSVFSFPLPYFVFFLLFPPPVFALLSSHFSSYVSPQHFSFPISPLMLSFVSILFSSFPFPHISILLLISLSSSYLPFSPTVCPYLLSFILPISTCPPVTPPLSSSSSSLESVVWNSSVLALKLAAVPR